MRGYPIGWGLVENRRGHLFTKIVQESSYYILLPFLLISAYFGVKVGKVILGKISQEVFRKIVLFALLLVGIKLLF